MGSSQTISKLTPVEDVTEAGSDSNLPLEISPSDEKQPDEGVVLEEAAGLDQRGVHIKGATTHNRYVR